MADLSRMERALRNADKAGDVEAAKAIAKALRAAMAEEKAAEPSMLESAAGYVNKLGQSVAQGATLGFMDEIAAGLDSPFVAGYRALAEGEPFDMGKAYDDRLAAYRQDQADFRRDNPVSAFVGEGAGAVAGTLATPLRALTTAPAGASMLAQMGRGAGAGAALGGAYGFGSGEGGAVNRAISAATGAAVGGVVGAAAPPVVEGIRKGGQFVADRTINMLPFRQAGAAERKVAEALMRDGMTPEQAAQRIKDMGPDAALMDVGHNTRRLARAAHTVPGEGSATIDAFVKARQEGVRDPATNVLQGGQVGRVTKSLNDLVPEQYTTAQRRGLEAARTQETRPVYQSIVDDPENLIPADRFAPVAKDPFIKGIIKSVKANKLYGMSDMPDNSMPVVDATKKRLDDLIGAAQRAGRKNEANLLRDKKTALVDVADEAFPDYKNVRTVWSDYAGVIDAGDLGRKFMTGQVDVLKDAVSRMSDSELRQFRIGAVQALRDKVGDSVVRADVTKKLMGNHYLEQKINTAFGDATMFKRYIDALKNEADMFETYAKITGNSSTAERMAEQADMGVDSGRIAQGVINMVNPASPAGFLRGVGDVVSGIKDRAAISGPMSRNLGEILTGTDVTRLNSAMKAANMSEAQRAAIVRALSAGGVVTGGRTAQGQ